MKFTIVLLLFLFACQSKEEKISASILEKHIKTLSDDSFEGRAPATAGEQKAIDYIVSQYKKAGLKAINGSYTQEMNLVKFKKNVANSSLAIKRGRKSFPIRSDGEKDANITFWSSSLEPSVDITNAEIIFGGYAVEAPEFGWDDFKGVDLKGKVLLLLNNDPQVMKNGTLDDSKFNGETRTYYGRWTYKFEQAKKHGAIGAIIIHTTQSAGYGYAVLGDSGMETHYTIDVEGGGFQLPFMAHADSMLCDAMARNIGKTLPDLFEMALKEDFKPISMNLSLSSHIQMEISKTKTYNVYGKLEGSDPTLKNEHIVFSAHYDHKGIASEGDDKVFNGAWDNGSGTASIMMLAEAFSKNPPKRSIIFLACAAEESGTLGSQFFVQSPPLALNKIIADINIDMPTVFGLTRDMAVVGVNSSSLGDDLKAIAKKEMVDGKALLVSDDPNPNAGLFYRSDQVHFAKKGIPALFVMSGTDFIGKDKDFLSKMEEKMYHTVEDEWNEQWDLSGLVRDLNVIYKLVEKVGNAKTQARWHKGNEFETAYNNLYK